MKKIIIACVLTLTLSGCGTVTTESLSVDNRIDSIEIEEEITVSRSKVFYCKVTKIDDETISMEEDGITYLVTVKGNEWVREGDKLLLECQVEALKEAGEDTYIVTDGLLSKLEKNEK